MTHNFKKKFGQNFISDTNLLEAMARDSGICESDNVLEIGAGLGSLTKILDASAKKVVSYEIDRDLIEPLQGLGLKNTNFVFKDIMDEPLKKVEEHFDGQYKLIANLPYYITTPIIFKFLNHSKKITSLTVMVQKEVAKRIIAKSGDADYGILSIMISLSGEAKITRYVNRTMFTPVPNVDSAIVHIDVGDKFNDINREEFYHFIQACFAMRRKKLKNNLLKAYPQFDEHLQSIFGDDLNVRSENLSLEKFIYYFKELKKINNEDAF